MDRVITNRGGGAEALFQVALLKDPLLVGRVRPNARVAIGLQLKSYGKRVRIRRVLLLKLGHLIRSSGEVLDVVAVLVGDDVCLSEVTRGAESVTELGKERERKIDLSVARAVERTGPGLGKTASRSC